MATLTVGYAWTAQTRTMLTGANLLHGSATFSCRCAWNTALAPLYVQMQVKAVGGTGTCTGRVQLLYKWYNLTTSASNAALLDVAKDDQNNWNGLMSFEMNTASTVAQSTIIPVQGKHLAVGIVSSAHASVSAISVVAIGIHLKVI